MGDGPQKKPFRSRWDPSALSLRPDEVLDFSGAEGSKPYPTRPLIQDFREQRAKESQNMVPP